jgi:hypothetical protein
MKTSTRFTLQILFFSVICVAQGEPDNLRLFLLIGQSNMAGRGKVEAQDKIPHPRVFVLTKELSWIPAIDPLHFDKPGAGVGLGSSFARTLADADPHAVIGLIPAAVGGTSLSQWRPGGELYTAAVRRTREALKHGALAGILWHQGEGDSSPAAAETYPDRFARMIARLRADLDAPDVPVIVGETGRFRDDCRAINEALSTIPKTVPGCAFASAEGLADRGDKVHFDAGSLRIFGRRYADAWLVMTRGKNTPRADKAEAQP